MGANRTECHADCRSIARLLLQDLMVVAGTGYINFGFLGWFSDLHKKNRHSCNAVHLYAVLISPWRKIASNRLTPLQTCAPLARLPLQRSIAGARFVGITSVHKQNRTS